MRTYTSLSDVCGLPAAYSRKRRSEGRVAIYHLNLKTIGRSDGRSATGAAAYRAGCRLADRRTGLAFDYTRKRGCDGAEILTPVGAPAWASDREELWNRVEEAERRKDAQLAREVEFALPVELTPDEMKRAARSFVREQFVELGMVVDIAFHHLAGRNPHAHCLLTLRPVVAEGFGPKERAWNDRAMCGRWREAWARHANQALAEAGRAERIDHRPLVEQALSALEGGALANAVALDRRPTVHEARNLGAIEKNERIRAENAAREAAWRALEAQALAEARLMASNSDRKPRPEVSVVAIPCKASEIDHRRPQGEGCSDGDIAFRAAMATAVGLGAAAWRAADRDVSEFEGRLRTLATEPARRLAAQRLAERLLAEAKLERRLFVERTPRPPGFWIFNRRARLRWEKDAKRKEDAVLHAERQKAEAARLASVDALTEVEAECARLRRRLARALKERMRHGLLPSEVESAAQSSPSAGELPNYRGRQDDPSDDQRLACRPRMR